MNGRAIVAKPTAILALLGLLLLIHETLGATRSPVAPAGMQNPPPAPAAFPWHQAWASSPADSAQLRREAQRDQAEFERVHRSNLPRARQDWFGSCDEQIGSICLRFSGGRRWEPDEENPQVAAARETLLGTLEDIGETIPGDRWVLGQRVRYLGDVGRWSEAERLARGCGGDPSWWCSALLGYVLHRSGRAVEALDAFSRALGEMDPRQARAWNDPQVLVESPVHRWLRNPVGLTSDEALSRFWLLADPLYLTPGNERLAEHYSRRFAASIYAGTALTIGLSWGRSFEELLVRYGFIAGWERTFPRIGGAPDGSVVERYHPESRGLLPPLEALENPRGLGEGVWVPQDDRPRSSSAPALAPLVVEGLGQVARFRRDGALLILAAYGTPEDTLLSQRRSRAGILEWVDAVAPRGSDPLPGQDHPGASLPDTLAGLFLVPEKGDGPPLAAFGAGGEGVLQLAAPLGGYLLSLEVWSHSERWGARIRHGIEMQPIPADVPSLSDLLLLHGEGHLPDSLPDALPRMRPGTHLESDAPLTVAWEVYGLGARREPLAFRLSLEEEETSLLRRALVRTRLLRRSPVLSLSWEEGSSHHPEPLFRALDLELPPLRPGSYVLRLELDIPYRTRVHTERRLTVSRDTPAANPS